MLAIPLCVVPMIDLLLLHYKIIKYTSLQFKIIITNLQKLFDYKIKL